MNIPVSKPHLTKQCKTFAQNAINTGEISGLFGNFITDFEDEPYLICYPSQLNQVLMNLVVNACDAIRERQAKEDNNEPGKIIIGCRSLISEVQITIKDNGSGMDESTKARLFEPFYTTKEVGKGSGLGLSISYGIVKKHQGQLTVESQTGVGTVFKLLLPFKTTDINEKEAQASKNVIIG